MHRARSDDPGGPVSVSAGQGGNLALTGERTLPGIEEENYWFSGT